MLDYFMAIPGATLAALIFVARLAIGSFLLPSGLGKLADLTAFTAGVRAYRILPERLVPVFSRMLPWLEITLALMLLLGILVPTAALITSLLVACFTIAVGINLARGREIDCQCHGVAGSRSISWGTIARNLPLIGLSLWLGFASPLAATWADWLQRWAADLRLINSPVALILSGCLIAFWWLALLLIEWIGHLHSQTNQLLKDQT